MCFWVGHCLGRLAFIPYPFYSSPRDSFFFFLMNRRPPSSPLFPYTPLSGSAGTGGAAVVPGRRPRTSPAPRPAHRRLRRRRDPPRAEPPAGGGPRAPPAVGPGAGGPPPEIGRAHV